MKWPENLEKPCTAGRWPQAQLKVAVMLAKNIFILTVLTGTVISFCHQEKPKCTEKCSVAHPSAAGWLGCSTRFPEFTQPYPMEAAKTKDSTNLTLVGINIHVKAKELQSKGQESLDNKNSGRTRPLGLWYESHELMWPVLCPLLSQGETRGLTKDFCR